MNRSISIVACIILIIGIALLLRVGPQTADVEQLRSTLQHYGIWAIAISTGLMIAQAIVSPLPANVITITNALVFGPFWGGLLSWATMVMGASLCFVLSRVLGKPFAAKIVGNSLQKVEAFFKKYGLQAMFFVRIMPFVPFDAVSWGAGLIGIPFSRFLLATAIGIIPSILAYSYLGTFLAGIYWWMLVVILTSSLVGIIVAAFLVRKTQPANYVKITPIQSA